MSDEVLFFNPFVIFIVAILLLDLLLAGRESHEVSVKEAAIWSGAWVAFKSGFVFFTFLGRIHSWNSKF